MNKKTKGMGKATAPRTTGAMKGSKSTKYSGAMKKGSKKGY